MLTKSRSHAALANALVYALSLALMFSVSCNSSSDGTDDSGSQNGGGTGGNGGGTGGGGGGGGGNTGSGNQCADSTLYPNYLMAATPFSNPTQTYVAATPQQPIESYTPTFYNPGTPTYSITPSLPSGLSLDPSTGVLSGTPTSAAGADTLFTITVQTDLGQSYACDFRYKVAAAGAAGASTALGATVATRVSPTAVRLTDGKVLIVGGTSGGAHLRSAELFDPATSTFSATNQMSRYGASTATLLGDGTVLVAGGYTSTAGTTPKLTLEIYDPAAGTFSTPGAALAHAAVDAVLLNDGKVLFLEGASACDANAGTSTSYAAEIYDPSTQTVSAAGFIGGKSGTLLQNGKVLVRGYQACALNAVTGSYSTVPTAAATIFDPSTSSATATGFSYVYPSTSQGPPPRKGLLRADGTVIFADFDSATGKEVFQIFDPVMGTFTSDVQSPLYDAGVPVRIQTDGSLLLASPGRSLLNTYSPTTNNLSFGTAVMVYNHGANGAVVPLASGALLIVGKSDYGESYNP